MSDVEFLIKNERWSLIDDLLNYYAIAAWRLDVNMLLTWAKATNVCRDKLQNRKRFVEQCKMFHPKLANVAEL